MAGLKCGVGGETCSLNRASVNNAISGNGMHVTRPSYVIQRLGDSNLIAASLQYPIAGDLLSQGLSKFYLQMRLKFEVN